MSRRSNPPRQLVVLTATVSGGRPGGTTLPPTLSSAFQEFIEPLLAANFAERPDLQLDIATPGLGRGDWFIHPKPSVWVLHAKL
jgi:hypothetical protein